MKVVDLTHTISEKMPVFPGTELPKLSAACTVEENGFKETLLYMYSHTGTHIDAPAHMFKDGTTLDSFDAAQFAGNALIIDCTELKPGELINMSLIEPCRELAEKADFLLFRTGWDRKWGSSAYFEGFPCISPEVSDFIARTGKKGVGLDTISIDPISDSGYDNHKKLLSGNTIVIIENLCNLDLLGNGLITLIAAPLKFENADGAPARVFALPE
ncbi:MAG: cyclase family protein [Oscillospiraceae bacterium]|nr:cyclase family protein [Oscillospiraceae bacterium]